jgi:RyR domain-containing protein
VPVVPDESETIDDIAHAIHARWCELQRTADNPAPPTWAELDDSRRESSRSQARDISSKLRAIGCEVAPLSAAAPVEFTFTDAEVEFLAGKEHDRWMQERNSAGWTLGPKDPDRKTTPYLVPFADLPSEIANYDRVFVREIPTLLASAGLRVVRAGATR